MPHGKATEVSVCKRSLPHHGAPESAAELELLRKGDPRKVMCDVMVKRRTSVKNDWLASRVRMGYPAAMGEPVCRALKDPKSQKIHKKYDKIHNSKD